MAVILRARIVLELWIIGETCHLAVAASAQPWLAQLCWPKMFRVEVFIRGIRLFKDKIPFSIPKEGFAPLTGLDALRDVVPATSARARVQKSKLQIHFFENLCRWLEPAVRAFEASTRVTEFSRADWNERLNLKNFLYGTDCTYYWLWEAETKLENRKIICERANVFIGKVSTIQVQSPFYEQLHYTTLEKDVVS